LRIAERVPRGHFEQAAAETPEIPQSESAPRLVIAALFAD
jgi:hypothetical protein